MLATECLLEFVRSRLPRYAKRNLVTPVQDPFGDADVWVLASLLQKAIRRSDLEVARRAGHQLLRLDANRLWRRLMTVALEDIGIGDPARAAEIVAIATSAEVRKLIGPQALDVALVSACEAVKDRTADHLISILRNETYKQGALASASNNAQRAVMASKSQPWLKRVEAGWLLEQASLETGAPSDVFPALEELDVPTPLVAACKVYRRRGRDGLAALTGLAWLLWQTDGSASGVRLATPAKPELLGELPDYALDPLHTRLGQRAVELWLRSYLTKVPFTTRQVAAALWNRESAFCARVLDWPLGRLMAEDAAREDLIRRDLDPVRHAEIDAWVEDELAGLLCARKAVLDSERRKRAAEPRDVGPLWTASEGG
jgi:hypothetical protein